jgi:hypothetical protein
VASHNIPRWLQNFFSASARYRPAPDAGRLVWDSSYVTFENESGKQPKSVGFRLKNQTDGRLFLNKARKIFSWISRKSEPGRGMAFQKSGRLKVSGLSLILKGICAGTS